MKRLEAAVEHSMTVVLTPEDCAEILRQHNDSLKVSLDIVRDAVSYSNKNMEELRALIKGQSSNVEEPVEETAVAPAETEESAPVETDVDMTVVTQGTKEVAPAENTKEPKKRRTSSKILAGTSMLHMLVGKYAALDGTFYDFVGEAVQKDVSYSLIDKFFKMSAGTVKSVLDGSKLSRKVVERAIIACPELEKQLRYVACNAKHEPLKTVRSTKEVGSQRYTALNKVLSGADKKPLPKRISETADAMGMSIHDFAILVDVPPLDLARYVAGDRLSDARKDWIEDVFSGTHIYDER